ncbi:MAG: DUF4129 domain-containing protein [Terriglobales bacterium]|jgi:hypothetical protein
MKTIRMLWWVALLGGGTLLCCAETAFSVQAVPQAITLEEYRSQIQDFRNRVAQLGNHPEDALALHDAMPDKITVSAAGEVFPVDLTDARRAVGEYVHASPGRREALQEELQARFVALDNGAAQFLGADHSHAARGMLQAILDRREFRSVSEPSLLEVWRDKVSNWLLRWLQRLWARVPKSERGSQLAVWILITIVACALAIWLKRIAGRRQPPLDRTPMPFAPSARDWRLWLEDARTAANAGQWRDAVHLAYWAGISHLEESGAWVPDRARTPREYLRLLSRASTVRAVLGDLTGQFESIWYGGRGAAAEDFQQTLRFLEQLGCR